MCAKKRKQSPNNSTTEFKGNKRIRPNLAFKNVEFKGVVGELAGERCVSMGSMKEVERRKWAENEVERLRDAKEELKKGRKRLEKIENELKEAKERVTPSRRVKIRFRSVNRIRNKEEDLEREKREWEATIEARARQTAQATNVEHWFPYRHLPLNRSERT
ncbi:hypothetical protein PM082_023557 [Marasmius tenuissimus]|nr:hypothetical protein PM082_023557 [Marasmius tenuissimus]